MSRIETSDIICYKNASLFTFLSNFDYKIKYHKSADNVKVDYLSRNLLSLNDQNIYTIDNEYVFQESVKLNIDRNVFKN